MAVNTLGIADLESVLLVVRPDFVKIDARQVSKPEAMQRVIGMARESGTRPIFMRVESMAQRDFLLTLPNVLLQGWAIARPSVMPNLGVPESACRAYASA